MILNVKGDVNRYYVQSLCMLFFPGSTFGEGETSADGIPEVDVEVYKNLLGDDVATVSIRLNDKVCTNTCTVSTDEEISIATHASIAVGRALFAAGKELLSHTPPWGILTGVRPAKIAGDIINLGNGILKTKKIMRDEYLLNPQKAALAVSVANTENKLLKKLDKDTCSLYVSIPFCPTRCSYCSFVSYTTPRLLSLIDDYIDALIEDLFETVETIRMLGMRISTVYIGGGTPTTLDEVQLEKLLAHIAECVDISSLSEFSLEAGRPDTITKEKLEIAKKYGVNRISVNPQTLNDEILKEIGRRHTTEDFYRAYDLAINSGIQNINVDLIAGLPGDDFKNFSETIDKIIELAPTNVTVHTFCVKKAADALKKNSGIYSLTGMDVAKSISYSQLKTKFAGYKPYYMYRQKNTIGNLENVGFSHEGHECLYNVYMMEEVQTIFGIGAGAVTKLVDYDRASDKERRILRIFRPKYPYEYLRDAESKRNTDTTSTQSNIRSQALDFFNKNG